MILALKNNNHLLIKSDEILKDTILEITDESGKKTLLPCKGNNEFETVLLNDYKGKLTIKIKNEKKTVYQKIFTN